MNIKSNHTRHRVYQLARVRNYGSEEATLDVFHSMVLPAFDYVDYVWDRDNLGENRELQLIQNKALCVVYKVKLEANRR